ncbi:MAG TPA: LysR substrate-binding domain-containing protein [Burkholderiaceae bacterium]|nr:LysR substrate-binding domain-containing protein [Burkholderiaceae bacterium]
MKTQPHRPLDVGPLRAFEAVARLLSFSAAADELFLTQPAISRQIKGLETQLGAPLFVRGTRKVELTGAGAQLLRSVLPLLQRLDGTVRQIRAARGRRHVSVATFASFASLWLLPRLASFERQHPDIDIRIVASDALVDLADPEIDLALRYCRPEDAPKGARRLFNESLTPAVGRTLAEQIARGLAPPLAEPAHLARHTLLEEDDHRPSAVWLSWRHWLRENGVPGLEPARWMLLNFTYQQVQAALSGQGVALARLPLVGESLARGELVEPFGAARRLVSPFAYWSIPPSEGAPPRPEVAQFTRWIEAEAALVNGHPA